MLGSCVAGRPAAKLAGDSSRRPPRRSVAQRMVLALLSIDGRTRREAPTVRNRHHAVNGMW